MTNEGQTTIEEQIEIVTVKMAKRMADARLMKPAQSNIVISEFFEGYAGTFGDPPVTIVIDVVDIRNAFEFEAAGDLHNVDKMVEGHARFALGLHDQKKAEPTCSGRDRKEKQNDHQEVHQDGSASQQVTPGRGKRQ